MKDCQAKLLADDASQATALGIIKVQLEGLAGRVPLTLAENIGIIMTQMKNVGEDVGDLKRALYTDYLTKSEFEAKFEPVKRLVYGAAGLILTAVILAILGWIIVTKGK